MRNGFTLLELLVAVVLLGLAGSVIYGLFFAGVTISGKGQARLLADSRLSGLARLLERQVETAWFDQRRQRPGIVFADQTLYLYTTSPLIHPEYDLVLAMYQLADDGRALLYQERIDFHSFSLEPGDLPPMEETVPLAVFSQPVALSFDQESTSVILETEEERYALYPKTRPVKPPF